LTETRARGKIKVAGRVQGVGFRYFALQLAKQGAITGWIKNEPDGTVSLDAEGTKTDLDGFIDSLKTGAMSGYVRSLTVEWLPRSMNYTTFEIVR